MVFRNRPQILRSRPYLRALQSGESCRDTKSLAFLKSIPIYRLPGEGRDPALFERLTLLLVGPGLRRDDVLGEESRSVFICCLDEAKSQFSSNLSTRISSDITIPGQCCAFAGKTVWGTIWVSSCGHWN